MTSDALDTKGGRFASVFGVDLSHIKTVPDDDILAGISDLDDLEEIQLILGGSPGCSDKVQLVLRRRWGQLVPDVGAVGADLTARRVAAVDQTLFDKYLAKTRRLSVKGLLDYATSPEEKKRLEQVAQEQRDWLIESDAGRRWMKRHLFEFDGTLTRAQARQQTPKGKITHKDVIKAFDSAADEMYAEKMARVWRTGSKRLREVKAGERVSPITELAQLQVEIAQLCAVLQDFDVEAYPINDNVAMWSATDIYDDLILLGEWLDRTLSSIQGRLSDQDVRNKIAKLREVDGRTPEEIETALKLADRLERKLENRLTR